MKPCFSIVYYQTYVVLLFAGDVDIIEPPGPSMTAAVGDTVELVCENDDQSDTGMVAGWNAPHIRIPLQYKACLKYFLLLKGFLVILHVTKLCNKNAFQ